MYKHFKYYGLLGSIRLTFCFFLTRILYPNSRFIRFPFDIRGGDLIDLGRGLTTGFNCRIETHRDQISTKLMIVFGEFCQINDNVHIASGQSIIFGDNVLIASRVFITDINHGEYIGSNPSNPDSLVAGRVLSTNPVVIGNNVWLGEGVAVLAGVTLGNNVIIGANSVVTKSIESNSIAVGNPANIIKVFDKAAGLWVNPNK